MDFRELLERKGDHFAHIEFKSGLKLSVQASEFAYSKPRENGFSPYDYTQFELAIMDDDGFVSDHPIDEEGLFAYDVAGYTSTKKVQEIFEKLLEHEGGLALSR